MSEVDKLENDQVTPVVDIAAGLFLAAMAITALVWLIPNYIVAGAGEYDIGPTFFPKLTAWVVLTLSLSLVAIKIFGHKVSTVGRSGKSTVFEIIVWSVISALVLIGINKIGFLITASLLIVFGAIVSGNRVWWLIAALAVIFPLLVNQLVWVVFTVDLP